MIRAISYTVLFCGASAGAALGLAFVHDAQIGTIAPVTIRAAPQAAMAPDMSVEPIAVSFAPVDDTAHPTPRIAPTLQPAPQTQAVAPTIEPQATPARVTTARAVAPQPRYEAPARQVLGMSTQGQSDFVPGPYGYVFSDPEVSRSAPMYAPARTTAASNLRTTWHTGVYR